MLTRNIDNRTLRLLGLAMTVAIAAGCTSRHDHASPEVQIAQETCPVMGGAIDASIFVEHEGRKVYFCCQACIAPFKADPAKYLAKLDKSSGGPDASHAGHSD